MLRFDNMSNELILCPWDHLPSGDIIYSFSQLNTRINSLLQEFRGLHKQLDLRYCSLSACRFFFHQVPTMMEWRLGLTVLKLDNPYRCAQTNMFAEDVIKSVVADHFVRQGKSCDNASKDNFRVLMAYSKHIQPIFPQLVSFFVFQSVSINEDSRDALLYAVAGGSAMRTFTWDVCFNQTHHSRAFFDWLFRCSVNLVNYQVKTPPCECGFELNYLTISILNLTTLHVLLNYLPQLEHLGKFKTSVLQNAYITNVIDSINITDQNLAIKLSYPKKLRALNLRVLKIAGRDCSCLEQLVDKFANTLETFSLFLIHYCNGEVDQGFNGHRLAALCSRLSHLRTLHFAILGQSIERPSSHTLFDFTQAFCTPFWLDGPLGRIRVCVDYHQVMGLVQMFSLPYTFPDSALFRTVDLIDVLFNTNEDEKETSNDLSIALGPLWRGMIWLIIFFLDKQKIPISFLRTLQSPCSQGKILIIKQERGVLPDNMEDHVQLTHFTTLQLKDSINVTSSYDLQQLIGWIRLLPNIKCLYIDSTELKYWFTHNCSNQYLDTFLRNLDRLYADCSSIINKNLNEEIMIPILSFITDKRRFPRLEYLRFTECKHISSAWCNINKWIDFILTHINEHQLEYFRFDFIEKDHELTDIQTGDEIITISEPLFTVDIHRRVLENYISLWIERKYRQELSCVKLFHV